MESSDFVLRKESRAQGDFIILEYKGKHREWGPFNKQSEVKVGELRKEIFSLIREADGSSLLPSLDLEEIDSKLNQILRQIGVDIIKPLPKGDWRDFVNKTIQVASISPFFFQTRPKMDENGIFYGSEILWKLWRVKEDPYLPSRLILDTDGYVTPRRRELALKVVLDVEETRQYLEALPNSERSKIERLLRKHGFLDNNNNEDEEEERDLVEEVVQARLLLRPIPRLKDASILKKMDWISFIDQLISFKAKKDPRLKLVWEAHLLRGIRPEYNPHALEFTNGGTGKSAFYEMIGHRYDKITPNTFLGYAKSPEEIYPGVIHHSELVIACDQMESQFFTQNLRFLFQVLETGEGRVTTAGVEFLVKSKSPWAILGNPIGESKDPATAFGSIIKAMSKNPAMGRRFGLIIYGKKFKRVETKTLNIEEEWREAVSFFRAVEEYALPEIRRIYYDKRVEEWLREPIPEYEDQVEEKIASIEDDEVKSFLWEHGRGSQHRIKAGALNVAIVENLDKIALGEYSIEEILKEAEELLPEFVDINLDSIEAITRSYEEEISERIKRFFESPRTPNYLKEIISAIELYRREILPNVEDGDRIRLAEIPYIPQGYDYLSKCIDLLKRRKNLENLNSKLRDLLKIELEKNDDDIYVRILDPQPCEHIEPIGRLSTDLPKEKEQGKLIESKESERREEL